MSMVTVTVFFHCVMLRNINMFSPLATSNFKEHSLNFARFISNATTALAVIIANQRQRAVSGI